MHADILHTHGHTYGLHINPHTHMHGVRQNYILVRCGSAQSVHVLTHIHVLIHLHLHIKVHGMHIAICTYIYTKHNHMHKFTNIHLFINTCDMHSHLHNHIGQVLVNLGTLPVQLKARHGAKYDLPLRMQVACA